MQDIITIIILGALTVVLIESLWKYFRDERDAGTRDIDRLSKRDRKRDEERNR